MDSQLSSQLPSASHITLGRSCVFRGSQDHVRRRKGNETSERASGILIQLVPVTRARGFLEITRLPSSNVKRQFVRVHRSSAGSAAEAPHHPRILIVQTHGRGRHSFRHCLGRGCLLTAQSCSDGYLFGRASSSVVNSKVKFRSKIAYITGDQENGTERSIGSIRSINLDDRQQQKRGRRRRRKREGRIGALSRPRSKA